MSRLGFTIISEYALYGTLLGGIVAGPASSLAGVVVGLVGYRNGRVILAIEAGLLIVALIASGIMLTLPHFVLPDQMQCRYE